MLVTIFADASCDDQLRIATYGAWAKTNGGTWRWAGRLSHVYEGSNLAELAAIGRALLHVRYELHRGNLGDRWIVETDSEWAIRSLARTPESAAARSMVCYIRKIPEGAQLDVRHVKGHMAPRRREPRHSINSWCDEAAKLELNRWRSELRRSTCAAS